MQKVNYLRILGLMLFLIIILINPLTIKKIIGAESNNAWKPYNNINVLNDTIYIDVIFFIIGLFLIFISKIPVNIRLLFGTILLFFILLEILLGFAPHLLLDYPSANMVILAYNNIYEYDPIIDMKFMKPNFETTMYWDGYRWKHKTDKYGFRNPIDRDKADIIMLGDSLIYGHGVDQDYTVGYFLEKMTNLTVSNLGRTADATYQEVYLLNQYGIKFKPKYVLLFFYANDIFDIENSLSKNKMMEFVNIPIENITFKERSKIEHSEFREKILDVLNKRPYVLRAFYLMELEIVKKLSGQNGKTIIPPENESGHELTWDYTKHAILQMKYISDLNNVEFILIPITHKNPNGSPEQFWILKDLASQNNISFIDIRSIYEIPEYYLPHDGHYSEDGHRALAEIVAKYLNIKEKEVLL
mgnify:CR=1 FL=1